MSRPTRHAATKPRAARSPGAARRPRKPKALSKMALEMDQFVELLCDGDDAPPARRGPKEPNAIFWDFWN
jgi:hypothetical protein